MSDPSQPFEIERYLEAERQKDLFRFCTAGSVDDGKSTLIGRLLLDSGNVYEDQVYSVRGKGTAAPGVPDLALLTDGLRAEREAGITIDVAYRYFSTARRRYILADTPGHEQYTCNMVTGASTADAVVVLVDATRGVLPQTRRHASIAALLGVRHLVLAVNKMDCVGYGEARFRQICADFKAFFQQVDGHERTSVHCIPVSALAGDQVVHPSAALRWFGTETLLGLLDGLPATRDEAAGAPFRMAVQRVVRTGAGFRGYAGQISSGTIRPGDAVLALPAGRPSRIGRIVSFGGDLAKARAPMSVTLTLDDEIDLGRGDVLCAADQPATVCTQVEATLVWMDRTPLQCGRRYLLKHLARSMPASVTALTRKLALQGTADEQGGLRINEAALATLELTQPLAADGFAANRLNGNTGNTGSFVLIDPETNATVAAGMIERLGPAPARTGGITADERLARFGHPGAVIWLRGSVAFAEALERALFAAGANVVLGAREHAETGAITAAGLLVLVLEEETTGSGQDGSVLRIGDETVSVASSSGPTGAIGLLRSLGMAGRLTP